MKRYIIPALAAMLAIAGCNKELESRVDNLENRVSAIEQKVDKANQDLANISAIISALQNNDFVTDVQEIKDDSNTVIGYKITFSQRGTITIYHGKDGINGTNGTNGTAGKDGKDGSVVGVKQDSDGVYYWTLDGEFILVNGKKVPVTGPKGDTGEKGDTVMPKLKIENDFWYISFDGGQTWEQVGPAAGGDSYFTDVVVTDDDITFELKDGTTVTLPRVITIFSFKLDSTRLDIEAGESVTIAYTIKGAEESDEIVIFPTYVTSGWTVAVDTEAAEISVSAPDPITNATIVITAVNNTTSATAAQALVYEKGVLTVQTDAYSVDSKGGEIEVKVSTNVEYSVGIDQDWVKQSVTKAVREETLVFTVEANKTAEARSAIITLTGTDGSVAKIAVAQEAGGPAIVVKPLFGFQPTVEDPHGMTKDAHRTMAVVGDYIILSNAYDVTKMPVYNRFTGEYLGDNIVNTAGIAVNDDQKFWAIASDDAGNLAALTYVDTRESGATTTNQTVRGYIWKNGIDAAPASVWWAGFYNYAVGASNAFSNLKIAGDMVNGKAVIASSAPGAGWAVFENIENGVLKTRMKKQLYEGSTYYSGNVIPINGNATSEDEITYISVSGNFRQYISYNGTTLFDLGDYWYMGGGQYQRNAIGGDYIDAAGHQLFGVLNGWYASSSDSYQNLQFYYQLVVSDLGKNPVASSLTDGLIFATRSSNNTSDDEKSLEGMGYGVQGMISPVAYSGTILGPNAFAANMNQIGDVAFATSGSNKVQVYAFVMNNGFIGFEITFND